ncbi:MAG: porin family protein [Alphaproteobacteria bacterium]|nr:porin family protein [Alphaproteobacteria bacterium]
MKKYLLSTLAIAGIMACATSASARDMYGVLNAGYGFGTKNSDDTVILGVGAGYQLDPMFRSDIIVDYRGWNKVDFKSDGKKADVWSIPVLMNIYGTYPIHDRMGVYAMAGLGMSYNHADSTTNAKSDDKVSFAWNVGAGVEYALNECWTMDLGYRYSDLGKAKVKRQAGFTGHHTEELTSHDIKLTARYMF